MLCWLIDPHFFGLAPGAGGTAPASWMGLTCFFVVNGSMMTNGLGSTAVTLVRGDEFDADVPVVVPDQKTATHLQASFLSAKSLLGLTDQYLTFRNRESEEGLSLLTHGQGNDRRTPSSSSRNCRLPLS